MSLTSFRSRMLYLLIGVVPVFFGCQTATLNVQTSPDEAEVFAVYPGQQPAKLGKTPLKVESQALFAHPGDSFKLLVQKEGFFTEQFLVPKSLFAANVKLDIAMKENKAPVACTEQDAAVEEVARNVAQAQSFIQAKRYEGAVRILLNLSDRFPNSSVVYDLLGNAYYLMKDLESALGNYEKSLRLSPNNSETQRMVNKLKSIYSIRAPAGN
ncbi:MAG: tetratricopeptide repeat protein [Bdellovibrionaceae bacterium]|nr:tetratricopeptide repeat protein [Bdellovibrionales bacterium]MCB9083381.1 tetratricopeptide repeat protein [Pseudobdellovibrionaceae bacterium]